MRITFNSLYRDTAAGIEQASDLLIEKQRQVSTGKRLSRASEDPSAAARSVSERAQLAMVEQYSRAANSMASRLNVTDTVLSDIIEKLTAAQTAAVSAQGTNKTFEERDAAATKLEGIRASLLTDLNTSFHGTYIFAGAASTTRPFVEGAGGVINPYAGSSTEVKVDVGLERTVTVGFDGDTIARGADTDDIFAVLDDLIAGVRAGDETAISTGKDGLVRAFDRATAAQTRIGAGMLAIQNEQTRLQEMKLAGSERLSDLEDADMAEAITAMTRAQAAYQAALGAAATATRVSLLDYLG